VPILYWLVALLLIGGSRFMVRMAYHQVSLKSDRRECVVIYGAGSAGAQLAVQMLEGEAYLPVAFLDDDPAVQGTVIRGIRVHHPARLRRLVRGRNVSQVLLAMPGISRLRRREIVEKIQPLAVNIRTIPPFTDLMSGRATIDDLREVRIEDLLGRDPMVPDEDLLDGTIAGKCVMVTGAGGSIGSELCRQILERRPKRLVLVESNEFNLFQIEQELKTHLRRRELKLELVLSLSSVTQGRRMRDLMRRHEVQTVYHAAAYKHVPLVEYNAVEGVWNNTLGTLYTAVAARDARVERFILMSTDKAVRPANVMGASKRVAEYVLQSLARETDHSTLYSMVRFGNVLGSSGSVVPEFRRQIREGGPVRVTHPDIIRYFMTIPEAASLALQAGTMAKGGDVFVLDMGEPIRIHDLARRMIHLSGLSVQDEDHPDGDIEIVFSGLRPGEKLYEELLIGENVERTGHPKIMRSVESSPSWAEMQRHAVRLEGCRYFRTDEARDLLRELVKDFMEPEVTVPVESFPEVDRPA
jgi:FlaA1/EpsC-like NDP-sugar epimerase